MGGVQSAYNMAPEIGFPGQLTHPDNPHARFSYWAEGDVYVGRAVIKGTATAQTANKYNDKHIPFGVKHPTDSGDTLVGIALRQVALPNDDSGLPYYADETLVSVLQGPGAVYAIANEATSALDPVYAVYSVGDSGLAIGDLIKDAVAGTTGAAIQLAGAYWHTAVAAGDIGIVVMTKNPVI